MMGGHAPRVTVRDFTSLTALTADQQDRLRELEEQHIQGLQRLHAIKTKSMYRNIENKTARLSSGYDMPLVGVGTWYEVVLL